MATKTPLNPTSTAVKASPAGPLQALRNTSSLKRKNGKSLWYEQNLDGVSKLSKSNYSVWIFFYLKNLSKIMYQSPKLMDLIYKKTLTKSFLKKVKNSKELIFISKIS